MPHNAPRCAIALIAFALACGGGDAPPQRPVTSAASAISSLLSPDVTAACDLADTLLARAPGAKRRRSDLIPFDSAWSDPAGRTACQVAATGVVSPDLTITDSVIAWLTERGWSTATTMSADGTDGTVQGLRRGRVTCVLTGRWEGGDDSDTTYVPIDSIEVLLTCAPLVPRDTSP